MTVRVYYKVLPSGCVVNVNSRNGTTVLRKYFFILANRKSEKGKRLFVAAKYESELAS